MRWALIVLSCACASPVPRTPEAAFSRLQVAVGAQDARLLYDALETESRWALDSVWKTQRDIGALVEKGFPPDVRDREKQRVSAATSSGTAREFLRKVTRVAAFSGLGDSNETLGNATRVTREGERAQVLTSTGKSVSLAADTSGMWGYAGLHDELSRFRDDVSNDWKRLSDDARLFQPR